MSLLVIRGSDGKSHLIHSGQIGPITKGPRSTGWWEDVWARVDEPAPKSQSTEVFQKDQK